MYVRGSSSILNCCSSIFTMFHRSIVAKKNTYFAYKPQSERFSRNVAPPAPAEIDRTVHGMSVG